MSLAILLTVVVSAASGDQKPPDAESFNRFEEKFLAFVRDPDAKNFRAVADFDRMRANAVAFLKSISAKNHEADERLIEEWLTSLEPICGGAWESAKVVSVLSTKEGVSKSRLRLRSANADQVDCLVWIVEQGGERRFIDIQRLPEGTSAALQTHLAIAGDSARALADEYRQCESGSRSDPRPILFRNQELAVDPLRRHRDRLYLAWAGEAGRPKLCLRYAVELKRHFDDDAAVAWLIAKAHYQLDQPREAVRSLEWYESVVGKDSWSHLLRAKLHKQEGRFADARRELADALKHDPTSIEALIDLFEVTSPREKNKAAERLPSGETFDSIAWTVGATLSSVKDAAGLEGVLKQAEKQRASDEVTAYLRGEFLLAQGKMSEAAEPLTAYLPKSDEEPEDADDILDLYCEAMHRLGKAEEAYHRAKATSKKAFSLIADKLDDQRDAATLDRIAAEHLQRHPDDGAGIEWYASSVFRRKKYSEAARVIDRFLARPNAKESDAFEPLRAFRVRIFIAERKLDEALKFIGDDQELFETAAEELADEGRGEELTRLLDGFAPHADDPVLFTNWKAEAAFLKEDYQLAFAYFSSLLDPKPRFSSPLVEPKPRQPQAELDARRRVLFLRTLVRLGFKTGIDRVAEKVLFPDDEIGFALAYAAVSHVEKFEVALENCLEAGLEAPDLLSDPDLGPMLETPALAKVRDKVLLDPELNP
jgi:tetratricopeptide (TPR) repeat protein